MIRMLVDVKQKAIVPLIKGPIAPGKVANIDEYDIAFRRHDSNA